MRLIANLTREVPPRMNAANKCPFCGNTAYRLSLTVNGAPFEAAFPCDRCEMGDRRNKFTTSFDYETNKYVTKEIPPADRVWSHYRRSAVVFCDDQQKPNLGVA